ncbi:MAG TPA: O-antigen ligase family protein, partial [Gemmataceae bacterium]|nr:O-antigen ligase family protein [Gemmataceae bacterium]
MTKTPHKAAAPSAPAPAARLTPDLLRRLLLVLVTALLVAGPLVPGEDPGLLGPTANPAWLTLALLWLVAAVAWAVWRLWSGDGIWQGGLAEAGLLLVAGMMFLSAGRAAAYRHPAWLIAWQWLVLLILFSLVRQLARSPVVRHGLLAAVVATGVAAAAQGIYQAAYELPRLQAYYAADRELLRHDLERRTGRAVAPDDPEFVQLADRLQLRLAHGTFNRPDTFAAYLALLLPAAFGFGVVAWRRRHSTWQPVLALTAAGIMIAALALALGRGTVGEWFHAQLDCWTATAAMIRQHPWLGVGPGNFSRLYPRFMPPTAAEKLSDPHNFVLEVWSSAGIFALVGLLVALVAVFAAVRRRLAQQPSPAPGEEAPAADSRNWEFYVGGMVGLLLAYLLRAAAAGSPGEILVEGAVAAARSVVWFLAFGLALSIPWSGPGLRTALAAGLVACLVGLCFAAGISFPSLAGTFWALAALAVAGPGGWPLRHRLALFLPFPALAALCLVYLFLVFLPVTAADRQMRLAYLAQARYRDKNVRPQAPVDTARLVQYVTNRLEDAHQDDPASAAPLIALASWHMELLRNPKDGEKVLRELEEAARLDPEGKEERMLLFQARLRLAERSEAGRQRQLDAAVAALEEVLTRDPTEAARLHYRLADALLRVRRLPAGYGQLFLALQENATAPGPAYRLAPAEREDGERLRYRFFARVVGPAFLPPPGGPLQVVP